MNIKRNLDVFLKGEGKNKGRYPAERSASFDYCFNYFQSFRERDTIKQLATRGHMQTSCLQLGFYLASWGMLRGSSFLLQKSIRVYEPLIQNIAKFNKRIWMIDVDVYDDNNIKLLLDCRRMIVESLGKEYNPSPTLVTKIMLGVFGNVPAFDNFFRFGLGLRSFGADALQDIARFYKEHRTEIDGRPIYTLDSFTGLPTE